MKKKPEKEWQRKTCIYKGGWCLRKGAWISRLSVQCQAWVRFPASALSTLTPTPGSTSLHGSPCVGQDGVCPQNRSWRHHPCQNHSDFTTHGTCEHDTKAWWKTACRTNSVTAGAIWNECSHPTSLDLVDPYPYSCQVWISLSSLTECVTHESSGSKPNKFTMLHFWLNV